LTNSEVHRRPHALSPSTGSRFAVDVNGNMTQRVVVSSREVTTIIQAFDPRNRLEVTTNTVSGVVTHIGTDVAGATTRTIHGVGAFGSDWVYDAAGRVVETVYPTGETVQTQYNLRGLPTSVIGLDTYLTDATYNAAGQPLRQTWGNTRQTEYAYEPDTLRLQHLQVSGGLLDLGYTYRCYCLSSDCSV